MDQRFLKLTLVALVAVSAAACSSTGTSRISMGSLCQKGGGTYVNGTCQPSFSLTQRVGGREMANEHSVQFAGGILGRERHICALFHSRDEEHRVLRSFITEGLDREEKAVHIVDPEQRYDHIERLREAGIDVERAMERGQLEVRPWQDAYLRGDHFDQDAMLALIEELLGAAGAAGYRPTRLLAHMEWALLDKPGVNDLLEYETRLNYVLPKYEDPVICSYDLSRFGAGVAVDILRTHPVVIVGGVLQENPFFIPPDQFLLELRERASARRVDRVVH